MERNERERNATEEAPAILEGPIALMPEDVRMRLGIVKTDRGWEMPAKWIYAMMSLIPRSKLVATINQKKGSQNRETESATDFKKPKKYIFHGTKKQGVEMIKRLCSIGCVDKTTADNANTIIDMLLKGEILKGEKDFRLIWIGEMPRFRHFYKKFFYEFFIGHVGIGAFFMSICRLEDGETTKEKVEFDTKGKKKNPPDWKQKPLDELLEKIINMK